MSKTNKMKMYNMAAVYSCVVDVLIDGEVKVVVRLCHGHVMLFMI